MPGTVTYAGTSATFRPTSDLTPNTSYTATITIGATDQAGNALAADYVWTFTTGRPGDRRQFACLTSPFCHESP